MSLIKLAISSGAAFRAASKRLDKLIMHEASRMGSLERGGEFLDKGRKAFSPHGWEWLWKRDLNKRLTPVALKRLKSELALRSKEVRSNASVFKKGIPLSRFK